MARISDYAECVNNDERFSLLLRRLHAALLKPYGFKKDGQTLRLIWNENQLSRGAVLNFQKSAWNDRTELRFTVNLGRKSDLGMIDSRFREWDCGLSGMERLGCLAKKYGFDQWWSITEETDMNALEQELLTLLREDAFPWLNIQEKTP